MRIFKYVAPYRWKFSLGLLFLLLSAVTFMSFPGLIGSLIGGSDDSKKGINQILDISDPDTVAILLFGAFLLQAIFSFFRIVLFAQVTESAIANLRMDVYRKLIHLPVTFFSQHRVGELNSRISNDIGQLQETFMTTLAELIRQVLMILVGVSLLLFYSVKLSLLMLVTLPVMILIAFFFGRFIRTLSKKTQSELAASQTVVDETLQAIQSVKSYANEEFESQRYLKLVSSVKSIAIKGAKWRGAFASFIILGLFGTVVLVIWYGVKLMNAGEISLAVFTSFLLYSLFVGGSVGGVADVFGKLQKAVGATEDLFDLMDEESEESENEGKPSLVKSRGEIEFADVSFSYPTRPDRVVLRNLNLKIASGEKVAVVGSSGAGKSTLASMILRFYDPNEGVIKLDGKDIRDYTLHDLRKQIAYVPQEILLFGGTIRENIAYGKLDASDEEIIEAAKQANAWEFLQNFSEGLDTVVGERGVQLSGGQRQRVAIARAILKDPKILILDEATSSLDAESERLVQDALDRLMEDRTSIIIAHRLSTIRKADTILTLDQGMIIEKGTHEELINLENGVYRRLSELQFFS